MRTNLLSYVILWSFHVLLNTPLSAQDGIFHAQIIDQHSREGNISEIFSGATLIEFNSSAFDDFVHSRRYDGSVEISVGERHRWKMILDQHDIRGPGFRVRSATGESLSLSDRNTTFRGHLEGNGESLLRFTVREDYLFGMIYDGHDRYFIEPLSHFGDTLSAGIFVLYKEGDELHPFLADHCGALTRGTRQTSTPISTERSVAACMTNELGIALDYSYVQANGGVQDAIDKAIGVMNLAGENFQGSFEGDVVFQIVEIFVSTCSACDPPSWTDTVDGGVLLTNFSDWVLQQNGFENELDLGQLWTNRNFHYQNEYNVVGLAWNGGLCSYFSKYHLLEDFSSNMNSLRVLAAHEIGHNFGAGHDGSGGHIMAPTLNGSSTWSQTSIDDINQKLSSVTCLDACSPCPSTMVIPEDGDGSYQASSSLISSEGTTIESSATYNAPSVTLYPDFQIMNGAVLEINSLGCPQ